METARFTVDSQGDITISSKGFRLADCRPAIDGHPIEGVPVVSAISGDHARIRWTVGQGHLELEVRSQAERLTLTLRLAGMAVAPSRISVLSKAALSGGQQAWCMAQGMAGGARCIELPCATANSSSTCTAARADDGSALGLWCEDNTRFTSSLVWEGATLTCGFELQGIPLPDGQLELPALVIAGGPEFYPMLVSMAEAIGRHGGVVERPRQRTWCSWYYYYHHFTQADLASTLAGLQSMPDRGGISTVQIDAGYCTSLGDWLEPNHLWPQGLEAAFQSIRKAGFTPGIWIGPFMVGSRSRLARQHPEWLLRSRDGQPVVHIRNYGEHRLWHYPDEEYYALDTSHPAAFSYLREVIATLVRWGAGYVKTDFLFWGFHDSEQVLRATPGKTSVEYLRDVMRMIRAELGPERYLLGCIAPYMPCLGLVDGMRIAGDIGPQWSGGFDPQNMLNESLHAQPVEGYWFQSDPDALLVRDFHTGFMPHEVESLALWQAMSGGNLCTSDPLHRCAPDRQALWRFCDSTAARAPAIIPRYGKARDERLILRDLGEGCWALLALNATDHPLRLSLPIRDLIDRQTAVAHPWGPAGASGNPVALSEIEVELPSHGSRLWLLADRVLERLPESLSGFAVASDRIAASH